MKTVYFVRHGITDGNVIEAYQELTTPLSEKGRHQAIALAERFSKIKFDALVASTMTRAQQTAQAISEKTGRAVVSESLFHEILRPSAVRGMRKTDPEVISIMSHVSSLWAIDGKRYSDEENFYDLKNRALRALEWLSARKEQTMVVVTHGTILKMLIAVMMLGDSLDPDSFAKVDEFMIPHNTGITWVEYDNKYRPNEWQLITWNDHAHLG